MIKLALVISAVAGLIIGAIAGSLRVGVEVFTGLFALGLLMIIAYSVQELLPKRMFGSVLTLSDKDLIEDLDLVFDEETGQLVEAPATRNRRPRRRHRR